MKTIFNILLIAVTSLGCSTQAHIPSDFESIHKRMFVAYSHNRTTKSVENVLKKLSDNGSFNDIDYCSTEGTPIQHLKNMTCLAAAYTHPENEYYHSEVLKSKYWKALSFWIEKDHRAKNWWYRSIAYPKELSVSVVLMANDIKKDLSMYKKVTDYLYDEYKFGKRKNLGKEGANGADIVMGAFAAAVLNEDEKEMFEFKDIMSELLTIQSRNGILADYLFDQHSGSGRQLYFANYGKEFVNSVMYYLEFCDGTKYQTSGAKLIEELFINGVQWIFFSQHHDPNHTGRFVSSTRGVKDVEKQAERLTRLSNASPETRLVAKRIHGENSLEGNRMFWRFDYMVHRRTGYMTSSRMTSTRTVGNEAGNGDGELNYCSSNGVNYLFVTGKEYDGDFFKKMNVRQFPGITAEQDNTPLPIPLWGENGGNAHAYAGGASNGTYGASGMILERRGVKAHKAWFYFDDEYVCLGSGINAEEREAPIYTTLSQTNMDGKVMYGAEGKSHAVEKEVQPANVDWVMHGGVAYFNLKSQAKFRIGCKDGLFSLNIDHGARPVNEQYAYIVRPGLTSSKEADSYAGRCPVAILSNTEKLQAVRNCNSGITEAVFYQPGVLVIDIDRSIAVDAPSVVVWNEEEGTVAVANPQCESVDLKEINVTLTHKGGRTVASFALPQGEMAGGSVVKNTAFFSCISKDYFRF